MDTLVSVLKLLFMSSFFCFIIENCALSTKKGKEIIMNKRFIATALAVTILSSNIPTISFATSNTTVNKESIENLKVYKKTSLKPHEDTKKFNSVIHTN